MPLSEEQIKRIAEEAAKKAQPFFRDSDYHRTFEVRSVISEKPEEASEMIIEGRATVFNQTTELLSYHDSWSNVDVILEEEIAPEAVEHSDSRKCFLKFNHSDDVFPVARCKEGRVGPGTMTLIPQADGLDIPHGPLFTLFLGNACYLHSELDVLLHAPPREEREVLKHHPAV